MTLTDEPFEWLEYGRSQGWVSEVACATHDGVPMTDEEQEHWEFGDDDCLFVVRIWP
jgi:hypothetical protein